GLNSAGTRTQRFRPDPSVAKSPRVGGAAEAPAVPRPAGIGPNRPGDLIGHGQRVVQGSQARVKNPEVTTGLRRRIGHLDKVLGKARIAGEARETEVPESVPLRESGSGRGPTGARITGAEGRAEPATQERELGAGRVPDPLR